MLRLPRNRQYQIEILGATLTYEYESGKSLGPSIETPWLDHVPDFDEWMGTPAIIAHPGFLVKIECPSRDAAMKRYGIDWQAVGLSTGVGFYEPQIKNKPHREKQDRSAGMTQLEIPE